MSFLLDRGAGDTLGDDTLSDGRADFAVATDDDVATTTATLLRERHLLEWAELTVVPGDEQNRLLVEPGAERRWAGELATKPRADDVRPRLLANVTFGDSLTDQFAAGQDRWLHDLEVLADLDGVALEGCGGPAIEQHVDKHDSG